MVNAYDVIFMDHKMPDLDGVETLKLLRKQEEGLCQKVPVIAMTANVMSDAQQVYQDYGFTDYLEKPVNGKVFEKMLLDYLPRELVEWRNDSSENMTDQEALLRSEKRNKRKIRITTDCVCDLPIEWLERASVRWMYYYVHVNGARFCDGKEITSDNLLENLLMGNEKVYSEPASVEEYERFFADQLDEAEKVIHISMAANASRGYENAKAAAACFDNVTVVDSGHLSSGMGIAVLAAAEMAEKRESPEAILEMLEKLKTNISSSFVLDSTEKMYQSGKISKNTRTLCETFCLHPLLELSQSSICCHGIFVGDMDLAIKMYVKRQLFHKSRVDKRLLFITYAGMTQKQLDMVAHEVEKYVKFERVVFQKASATVSSNCGRGTVGLLFARNYS